MAFTVKTQGDPNKTSGSFVLPKGTYHGALDASNAAEPKPDKNEDLYIRMPIRIRFPKKNGEYGEMQLFYNFYLTGKYTWKTAQFFSAATQQQLDDGDEFVFDPNKLHMKPVRVNLYINSTGDRNEIGGFLPVED